ncbi:MAG: dethiobiotin synthase [Gammaproteobacteria bacterium]
MTVFVTGTDTGSGKTHVSAALVAACARRGLRAIGMKPVASGAEWRGNAWHNDDVAALVAAANVSAPATDVNPYLFELPASPHIAAAAAGRAIEPGVIDAAYRRCRAQADVVIVEGVGGWLVPISDDFLVADLAAHLALPVLLVVGVRLGCINHGLLTARAIAASGLPFAGYVANVVEPAMPARTAVLATLERHLPAPCLAVIDWNDPASLAHGAERVADHLLATANP